MNTKANRRVAIWLLSGCFLIFVMVVVGGITRLTGSGLSITERNVIMGTIPPTDEAEWQELFDKYQQIPQYELVNPHFELHDFKKIFWWEYIHRLIGRLLGIVFIIPFVWFLVTRQIDKVMIRKSLFLFALGGLQGFLGWYMVSSGLTERTSVSHIRLAIHLSAAFITFAFTFWYALDMLDPGRNRSKSKAGLGSLKIIFILLFVQIVYGAFVAGMHAGKMYNTFPLMNGHLIPPGMGFLEPWIRNLFDNAVTVQFIHRGTAIMLFILICRYWWKFRTNQNGKLADFFLASVVFQFLLGVFTLLSKAEITLASLHQIGAFLIFSLNLYLIHTSYLREHSRSEAVTLAN
ncbi:MAG: heme A synthase [Bacteroidetes bacterium]|nr:MAG: heme A synthase [Bacteroidota bacterium]